MASTWQKTQDFYNWALENGDPRTDPWLLVYSPFPVTLLFTLYLFFVALGPRLMQKWEPLRLKGLLVAYNLALVALSAYMFYEFLVTSVLANYSYLCQPVDYTQSELGMRMARVCWWFFFSKVIELLDTVIFILRKKPEQVTFLHVYHHGTMLFNWWAGVKYVPGGQAFFIGMLNSFVHIFMYLYYGLASLGPQMQRYLWWKRYLTLLQLVINSNIHLLPLRPWNKVALIFCLIPRLTYCNGCLPGYPAAMDQGEVWVEYSGGSASLWPSLFTPPITSSQSAHSQMASTWQSSSTSSASLFSS